MYSPETKIWSGRRIAVPKSSVGDVFWHYLDQHKAKLAEIFADDDSRMRFGELKRNGVRVALHLRYFGLGKGETVCIMAADHKYMSALFLGCTFIGAPFHSVDLTYGRGKYLNSLKISKLILS